VQIGGLPLFFFFFFPSFPRPEHLLPKAIHPPKTKPLDLQLSVKPNAYKKISWGDLHTVLTVVISLYVAMISAYGFVRRWEIFSPDQCSGINRFVAILAVPLQKTIMLVIVTVWTNFAENSSLERMITIFPVRFTLMEVAFQAFVCQV